MTKHGVGVTKARPRVSRMDCLTTAGTSCDPKRLGCDRKHNCVLPKKTSSVTKDRPHVTKDGTSCDLIWVDVAKDGVVCSKSGFRVTKNMRV